MKNMKITTTVTMSPLDYAINQYKATDLTTIDCITFKPDKAGDDTVTFSKQSIDCRLHNVKDVNSFAHLLLVAFYLQQELAHVKRFAELCKKAEENAKGLTTVEKFEQSVLRDDIIPALANITSYFSKEEIAFCKTDSFVNMVAGAITGDFTICVKHGNANVQTIVNALSEKRTDKDLKQIVTNFTLALTGNESDVYTGYHLNCNAGLLEDIKRRYYKGRKFNAHGTVERTYDTKGIAIRKEIALAIVEDLQEKYKKANEQ